jgi:chemotaxis protein histidine kinase CheA
MEDYFVAAQKGTLRLSSADVDVLLRGVDLLANIAAATSKPDTNIADTFGTDVQTLVAELDNFLGRKEGGSGRPALPIVATATIPAPQETKQVTIEFPAMLDAALRSIRQGWCRPLNQCTIVLDLKRTEDLTFKVAWQRFPYLAEHRHAKLHLGPFPFPCNGARVTGRCSYRTDNQPRNRQSRRWNSSARPVTEPGASGGLEQLLLSLKSLVNRRTRGAIDHCLRIVHSLKGDAGFQGLAAIRTVADAMETVLEGMRDGEIAVATNAVETLLVVRDGLAALTDDLERSQTADLSSMLKRLESVARMPAVFWQDWDVDLREVHCRMGTATSSFVFRTCGAVSEPRSSCRHTI